MATIVDCLMVTLGLDPSGLKAGASEAKGEMAELQEKSKELAEKTKREQKEFEEAVKTSSDAVSAFQTKAAEEAALAAAKVHELQKAASQPGASKAAASEVKAAIAAQNAQRAAASEQLKKLQADAAAAGIKLSDFQRKAAQEAEELKKQMKEVGHEAKEMAEKLKENGEKGAEMFDTFKEHAVEFLGVMASIGAFMAFTEHTIKAGAEMLHLSEAIEMDTEEISKWQNAVVIAGGSAEGLNSNLKTLGGSLVDIEKGLPKAKRALVAFNAIGITNLGKGKHVEIADIFQQLHEKMSNGKMSMIEAMELGKKVGITEEALIRTLHKGGEAYEEMMAKAKAAGTVSKEQAEAAEQAEEGMNTFKISMQRAMELIVQLALPAITAVSGALTTVAQWAHEHSGAIQKGLAGIAAALVVMNIQAIATLGSTAALWASNLAGSLATGVAYMLNTGKMAAMWAVDRAGAIAAGAAKAANMIKAGLMWAMDIGGALRSTAAYVAYGAISAIVWAKNLAGAIASSGAYLTMGASAALAWLMASGPIAAVVLGIGFVIGGLVRLYQTSEKFREVVASVFAWVKNYVFTVFIAIWDTVKDVFAAIGDAVDLVVGIFTFNGDKIKDSWSSLWGHVKAAVHMAWMIILFQILSAAVAIVDTVNKVWPAIKAGLTAFVESWKAGINEMVSATLGVFGSLWEGLKSMVEAGIDAVLGFFHGMWDGIMAIFGAGLALVTSLWSQKVEAWKNTFGGILGAAKAVWNGIRDAAMAPLQWIEEKLGGLLKLVGKAMSLFHATAATAALAITTQGAATAAPAQHHEQRAQQSAAQGPVLAGALEKLAMANNRATPAMIAGVGEEMRKAVAGGLGREGLAELAHNLKASLMGKGMEAGKAQVLAGKAVEMATMAYAKSVTAPPAKHAEAAKGAGPKVPTQAHPAKAYEEMTIAERLARFKEQSDAYDAKHRPAAGGVQQLLDMQKQARAASVRTSNSSSSHKEVNINGPINVQTQAADANGIVKDIGGAFKSHGLVDHADGGMV